MVLVDPAMSIPAVQMLSPSFSTTKVDKKISIRWASQSLAPEEVSGLKIDIENKMMNHLSTSLLGKDVFSVLLARWSLGKEMKSGRRFFRDF